MIIDIHTHTPRMRTAEDAGPTAVNAMWRPDQARPTTVTWETYLDAMAPVDRAICFNIARQRGSDAAGAPAQFSGTARQVNDETAAFVRAHPDKLIGFLAVHPSDSDALEEIDRATGDLGLRGIKLGANYQNFDPLSSHAFRVYERAQQLGLPVLFHTGTSPERYADLDYANPRHVDRIATAFPELRMVLAHMSHPWQVDCIAVIRKHPNVYADVSALFYRPWSYYNTFRLATEWSVLHKLLLGSDYPVATPQETIDALHRVNDIPNKSGLPSIPEAEVLAIVERDSLSLLGLA